MPKKDAERHFKALLVKYVFTLRTHLSLTFDVNVNTCRKMKTLFPWKEIYYN